MIAFLHASSIIIINKFYFLTCCQMSNQQNKSKRARASSAKVSHDRGRPSSGNSNKNANKIQFIQNMYGGIFTTKRYSNKNVPTKLGFLGQEIEASKVSQSKTHKQKEELIEENLQLKKEINYLKEELNLQKAKTEQMRRKNTEFTKQLNIKYNKEMYWSHSGPDMVRGVKQQYEQIKLKYEQKCLEYDLLTQQYVFSQAREQRVYADMLHQENQKLMKRIKQAKEEMKYAQHGTLTSAVEESIDLYKRYKFQIQQENDNLSTEVNELKTKVKVLTEELKVRDQKINYLDKLLIQRDNCQHAAWRKVKKLQKAKQQIISQFNQYKQEKEDALNNYEARIKRIKDTLQKQSQTQRQIFRHELQDKSIRIAKLQKEIAYLTTLLSYWKPLDEVNYLVSNNIMQQDNRSNAEYDRQVILEYSMGSTMIKYNVSKQNTHSRQANDQEYETKSIVAKSRKGSGDNTKNVAELMTKSIDITKKESEKKKRTQITADKRNTEQGAKSRKVTQNEVADICETLKYRFIGLGIPIDDIRKYFDYNADVDMAENEEDQSWNSIYINMREINRILQNEVFALNEADALSLSRYLIEDSPNDYVYCDPNNQNLRSVVKSIIKTAIGDYEISRNQSKILRQASQLLQRYHTNLESALRVTAPKGLISKKKLLQLFKGLGIQLNEELQDYFIGKVVIKSQNLSNLRYEILFQK